MAAEIKVTSSVQCTNGNLTIPKLGGQTQSIDQSIAGGGGPGFVKVATAGENLVIGDVTTPGVAYFKNVDPTNYIEVGLLNSAVFYPFIKLLPGEEYSVRLAALGSSTLHAKANTAEAKLYACILES